MTWACRPWGRPAVAQRNEAPIMRFVPFLSLTFCRCSGDDRADMVYIYYSSKAGDSKGEWNLCCVCCALADGV